MSQMYLSKLDAAKRQLDTAINLFFTNSDPVSIHTLASAAYEILFVFAKQAGLTTIIKDNPLVKNEYKKEVHDTVVKAQNFFKHGKKDLKEILKFNPAQTEFMLLDATEIYTQLTSEIPSNIIAYRTWFLLKYPDILYHFDEEIKKNFVQIKLSYNPSNREKFFDLIHYIDNIKNERTKNR